MHCTHGQHLWRVAQFPSVITRLSGLPFSEGWLGLATRAVEGHLPRALIRILSPAFSQVVENTAFFGDVVLRFPRIVHYYFDHNSNWNLLIRWGISFCNQSGVFDQGPHSPILSLVRTDPGRGGSGALCLVVYREPCICLQLGLNVSPWLCFCDKPQGTLRSCLGVLC